MKQIYSKPCIKDEVIEGFHAATFSGLEQLVICAPMNELDCEPEQDTINGDFGFCAVGSDEDELSGEAVAYVNFPDPGCPVHEIELENCKVEKIWQFKCDEAAAEAGVEDAGLPVVCEATLPCEGLELCQNPESAGIIRPDGKEVPCDDLGDGPGDHDGDGGEVGG